MKTHNKSITELKADLAHYQRMIPEAVNQKKEAEKAGRNLFANSLNNRIDFFRKQSTILKATIEKQESEATLCQVS